MFSNVGNIDASSSDVVQCIYHKNIFKNHVFLNLRHFFPEANEQRLLSLSLFGRVSIGKMFITSIQEEIPDVGIHNLRVILLDPVARSMDKPQSKITGIISR